jgi:hypothetical protein
MIAISLPAADGCWDNYSLSIEEAQDKLNELDAALDDAPPARASFLKALMEQLEEAIAEALSPVTVRSFNDNGPYFPPTQGIYQASSLREVLFHVRLCMEDNEQQIGIFDANGQCKGMWLDEAEPSPDGEGGMTMGKASYVLYRPGELGEWTWNNCLKKMKKA